MADIVRKTKQDDVVRKLSELGVHESDLIEKFVRASGRGGQKINKTSVAVYLHHIPTGIEVKASDSRSQATNRYYARKRLLETILKRSSDHASKVEQHIEKIRRQKRKRSKRAKEKMLENKRRVSQKKQLRKALDV